MHLASRESRLFKPLFKTVVKTASVSPKARVTDLSFDFWKMIRNP